MTRCLIAAPVHQKTHIFKEYLKGLDNLRIPEGWEVNRLFILHNCDELVPMVENKAMYGLYHTDTNYEVTEHTHKWQDANIYYVTLMKNGIIEEALERGYDYLFFVDSDLVLHPDTLMDLAGADKDIIAKCFWTKWGKDEPARPNAWDYDTYSFDAKREFTDESPTEWLTPGIYRVGMTGACTLIKRKVLEAGVNFSRVTNVNFWGEDRAFCVRAAVHGFEIWLDTRNTPVHLYRESEYQRYIEGG